MFVLLTYTASFMLLLACVICAEHDDIKLMNYTLADRSCQQSGELYEVSSSDLDNGYIKDFDLTNTKIENGQSAWIKGYTQLSTNQIAWFGCYNMTNDIIRLRPVRSVYMCMEVCKDYKYMGIINNQCSCLQTIGIFGPRHAISGMDCGYQDLRVKLIDKNEEYLSVYRILTLFGENGQGEAQKNRQCLASQYNETLRGYMYTAKSCYSTPSDVEGYFCTHGAVGSMTDVCYNKTFCKKERKTNWLTARYHCLDYNGRLVPYETSDSSMRTYWVAAFRSYKIVNEIQNSCLSVTRLGGKLMLEPDSCSEQKIPLCVYVPPKQPKQPTTISDISEHMPTMSITTDGTTLAPTLTSELVKETTQWLRTSPTPATTSGLVKETTQELRTSTTPATTSDLVKETTQWLRTSSTPETTSDLVKETTKVLRTSLTSMIPITTASTLSFNSSTDIALYITVSVAVVVIAVLIIILVRMKLTRRTAHYKCDDSTAVLSVYPPPLNADIVCRNDDVSMKSVIYDIAEDIFPNNDHECAGENQYSNISPSKNYDCAGENLYFNTSPRKNHECAEENLYFNTSPSNDHECTGETQYINTKIVKRSNTTSGNHVYVADDKQYDSNGAIALV